MYSDLLFNSSIVFVADGVSPSMFSEDFLRHHEVFPKELEVEGSITMPPLSRVNFEKGYKFEAQEGKVKLEIGYPNEIDLRETTSLPDKLKEGSLRLLDELAYLSFTSVGINFRFFAREAHLQDLTRALPENSETFEISYRVPHDEGQINVQLQELEVVETEKSAVMMDFNVHSKVSTDTAKKERHEEVIDILNRRRIFFERSKELFDDTKIR